MERRTFLQGLGLVAGSAALAPIRMGEHALAGSGNPYGALGAADANGLQLPPGFTSRIVADGGKNVGSTSYSWHASPDGAGTLATSDGGWILVSNSEVPTLLGGASAIRFGADGTIKSAYSILKGTSMNCAGTMTPWNSWLSCEEHSRGTVWECNPYGITTAVERKPLGTFKHESVAIDPVLKRLYLTEDEEDGCLYRFTPSIWKSLSVGTLEVAKVDANNTVTWAKVPTPNPNLLLFQTPTRNQVAGAARFTGGEGIAYLDGKIYFTTKGDERVWKLDTATSKLSVFYDAKIYAAPVLSGVDNIIPSKGKDLYVAEDGGNMEVVMLDSAGGAYPVVRHTGSISSEITGLAFNPAGDRLYFNSQRSNIRGLMYEVKGPFRTVA